VHDGTADQANALDGSITFDAIPIHAADIGGRPTPTLDRGGLRAVGERDERMTRWTSPSTLANTDAGNGVLNVFRRYPADTYLQQHTRALREHRARADKDGRRVTLRDQEFPPSCGWRTDLVPDIR
jgi:hypothetical protein